MLLDLAPVSTISHKIAVILAAVYFAVLAGILFWPSPVEKPIGGELTQFIKWLHNLGVPRWTVGYMQIEFTAYILLFIPFGIIVTLRLHRKRWWLAVPVAAAISGAVELAQTLFLPQRFSAWSDIGANTSGAFIGALLVLLVWSRRGNFEAPDSAAASHSASSSVTSLPRERITSRKESISDCTSARPSPTTMSLRMDADAIEMEHPSPAQ